MELFIKTRILMAMKQDQQAWLQEHVNDTCVQRAKADGWRSRPWAFREDRRSDKLIRPGRWWSVAGSGGWVVGLRLRLKGRGAIALICPSIRARRRRISRRFPTMTPANFERSSAPASG